MTMLHHACSSFRFDTVAADQTNANVAVVAAVLAHHPSAVTARDGFGRTPLACAMEHGASGPVVDLLLAATGPEGVLVRSGKHNLLPLHVGVAQWAGRRAGWTAPDAIRAVLDAYPGAALEPHPKSGLTPLLIVAEAFSTVADDSNGYPRYTPLHQPWPEYTQVRRNFTELLTMLRAKSSLLDVLLSYLKEGPSVDVDEFSRCRWRLVAPLVMPTALYRANLL
jgi:hypothetical protein